MTRADVARLVGLAAAAFPHMQEREMGPTVEVWHKLLGDIEYPVAEAALALVLSRTRYFPTVAEIREAAAAMHTDLLPAEMAWAEVLEQVRRVGSWGTPEWSHPAVGRAAETLYGGWVNLCQSLMAETLGVDRAHFMRIYQTLEKREAELVTIPPQVRAMADKLAARFSLPVGKGDA